MKHAGALGVVDGSGRGLGKDVSRASRRHAYAITAIVMRPHHHDCVVHGKRLPEVSRVLAIRGRVGDDLHKCNSSRGRVDLEDLQYIAASGIEQASMAIDGFDSH